MDIFIPRKLTKSGKPFGFVRNKGTQDIFTLTSKIKSIVVGADPITINEAKFQRRLTTFNGIMPVRKPHVSMDGKQPLSSSPLPKVSFAKALCPDPVDRQIQPQRSPGSLLTVEIQSGDNTWLQSCAIGDVKNIDILSDLPSLLHREGFLECEVKYLGGFRFLLQSHSQETIMKILSDVKDKLSQWFDWISPWSKALEFNKPGRLLWLQVEGLPLHAWSAKFLR